MQQRFSYRLNTGFFYHPDLDAYRSYGIDVTIQCADQRFTIKSIHDISPNPLKVLALIKLFNLYKLSPIHLRDAVCDMIS